MGRVVVAGRGLHTNDCPGPLSRHVSWRQQGSSFDIEAAGLSIHTHGRRVAARRPISVSGAKKWHPRCSVSGINQIVGIFAHRARHATNP
ncbi:hypothetical protein C7S13_8531 [Burkholderia cepacia]|nr:hypothetical protein [Burkholderia cepacia]